MDMTSTYLSSESGVHCRKREQVLDAARQLFITHGYGATSMDAIAAEADVSKATIYAHHDGKEALFAAVTHRECRRITARMAIPDDLEALALRPALTRIARSFLDAVFSNQSLSLLRMVVAESARFPELGRIFYDSAPGYTLANVIAYLDGMRALGRIQLDDCEQAAAQFLGALRGDIHLRALLGLPVDAANFDALADEAVATFVARYAVAPQ